MPAKTTGTMTGGMPPLSDVRSMSSSILRCLTFSFSCSVLSSSAFLRSSSAFAASQLRIASSPPGCQCGGGGSGPKAGAWPDECGDGCAC